MTQPRLGFLDFARLVVDALESAHVTYLIGGAVALWAWGEPRSTQDIDLVIELPVNLATDLSRELESRRMLVPPDILVDLLLQTEGDLPVNAIHLDSGYKADLFLVREGNEFRSTALRRRREIDFGPPLGIVYVHAPEDLILNKVAYFGLSQQTKHIRDIASILVATHADEFDWEYFDAWIDRLHLVEPWQEVKREVDLLR